MFWVVQGRWSGIGGGPSECVAGWKLGIGGDEKTEGRDCGVQCREIGGDLCAGEDVVSVLAVGEVVI